ncbi:MAG: PP2C family protein-serine/threonine phosphatase, partial [Spirochaetota bacterium]
MRIRYKIITLLICIILASTLPLALFLITVQERESISQLANYGKSESRILARTAINAYLMNAGDIESSRVDAAEMMEGYSILRKDGLLYADAWIITSETPRSGKILARFGGDLIDETSAGMRTLSEEGIRSILSSKGFREIQVRGLKGNCLEFSSTGSLPGSPPLIIARFIYSKEMILKKTEYLTRLTIAVVAGTIIILALIGFFFGGRISSPISRLTDAARRIMAGDMTGTPLIRTGDEVEELSETIAHMLDTIQRKITELETTNSRLEQSLIEHNLLVSIQTEIQMADEIQQSILPQTLPKSDNCRMAVRYIPMTTISGDFYRFHENGNNSLGILIADVSGHGIPAALFGAKLDVAFSVFQNEAHNPSKLLSLLNGLLCNFSGDLFITACYIYIDIDRSVIRYANAGHKQLMIHRR